MKRVDQTIRGSAIPEKRNNHLPLLFATLVTLCLWYVPYSNYILYPLRLFVTFLHEGGHALAALVTGLGVQSLHVHPDGSGLTWTGSTPMWDWLILSSGYVGTAVFGAALLQLLRIKSRFESGRVALYLLSGFLLMISILWAHNPFNNPGGSPDFFTLPVGLSLSAILFLLGKFTPRNVADFIAAFLAVQCGLNAMGDLGILLHLTAAGSEHNDAAFMAKAYLLPAGLWALTWASLSLGILGTSLWTYVRGSVPKREIELA